MRSQVLFRFSLLVTAVMMLITDSNNGMSASRVATGCSTPTSHGVGTPASMFSSVYAWIGPPGQWNAEWSIFFAAQAGLFCCSWPFSITCCMDTAIRSPCSTVSLLLPVVIIICFGFTGTGAACRACKAGQVLLPLVPSFTT